MNNFITKYAFTSDLIFSITDKISVLFLSSLNINDIFWPIYLCSNKINSIKKNIIHADLNKSVIPVAVDKTTHWRSILKKISLKFTYLLSSSSEKFAHSAKEMNIWYIFVWYSGNFWVTSFKSRFADMSCPNHQKINIMVMSERNVANELVTLNFWYNQDRPIMAKENNNPIINGIIKVAQICSK